MQAPQPDKAPASYERAYKREKLARQQAEQLLERRSRELFEANARVERQYSKLERAHDELKFAQAQLVQSEKMASVGQLAAGIAHEINNPVAFIASNLSTLKSYAGAFAELFAVYDKLANAVAAGEQQEVADHLAALTALRAKEDFDYLFEDVGEIITESTAGTKRVIDIVQGLKNFSRIDGGGLKDSDINEGIQSTLKIAWNELKYRCSVETDFGDLPLVYCFAGQLNQVFLNLLVNAAQASSDGSKIYVRTYSTDAHVYIEIEDTGCGISEENISAIFNPFFTTKEVGQGTGLGLSISYAIVEKHGGDISVDSIVGVGTKFTVKLPIAGPAEAAA